jgi:hypothetical protein
MMRYCKDCTHGYMTGGYWSDEPKQYLFGLIKTKGDWAEEEVMCNRYPQTEFFHPYHTCGEFKNKQIKE